MPRMQQGVQGAMPRCAKSQRYAKSVGRKPPVFLEACRRDAASQTDKNGNVQTWLGFVAQISHRSNYPNPQADLSHAACSVG